jgi:hypothetical protein
MPVNAKHITNIFDAVGSLVANIKHDLREVPGVGVTVSVQGAVMIVQASNKEGAGFRYTIDEHTLHNRVNERTIYTLPGLQDLIDTTLTKWRNRDQEQKDTDPCPET